MSLIILTQLGRRTEEETKEEVQSREAQTSTSMVIGTYAYPQPEKVTNTFCSFIKYFRKKMKKLDIKYNVFSSGLNQKVNSTFQLNFLY